MIGANVVSRAKHVEAADELRRFKPSPANKESGVEWLGKIPAHWEARRLKFVLAAPLKYGANEAAELDDPDLPRYVRITDIDESDHLRNETFKSLPIAVAGEYLLREGDLLFARSGATAGKTFLYRRSWGACAYAGYLIRARLDTGRVYPEFVRYFTASSSYWHWISAAFIQATIQNVSAERYASLIVPQPPLKEQRAIAAFLDRKTARIDALVAKKERLIELLQEKRTALITRAVTKGLDQNVPMKDSGVEWLGEIPAKWKIRRIAMSAVKITNGYVGPTRDILVNEGVRYLQSLHIKEGTIDFERRPYFVASSWSNEHSKSVLDEGDVLVVQTGDIGQVASVPPDFAGCNCHALIIIRLRSKIGIGEWLARVLHSDYGQHALRWSQTGALHPHLECGHVREIRIPFPPAAEQFHILSELARRLKDVDSLISKVHDAIRHLNELRTALISAAVTGKIDVRGEVA